MLEVLGLLIAQPDPPAPTPEIAFLSAAKQQIPPESVPWFQIANSQPWALVAQAQDYCRSPEQTKLPKELQNLAKLHFCPDQRVL